MQEAPAPSHKPKQASAGCLIVFVDSEMFRQPVDAGGQQSDLDLG
jgi:hypothetical protein